MIDLRSTVPELAVYPIPMQASQFHPSQVPVTRKQQQQQLSSS